MCGGDRLQRFHDIATHHPPHGLRRGPERAGRSGRDPVPGWLEALRRRCDRWVRCSSSTNSNRDGTHGRNVRRPRSTASRDIGGTWPKPSAAGCLSDLRGIAQRDHGHAANRLHPGAHHHNWRTSGLLRNGLAASDLFETGGGTSEAEASLRIALADHPQVVEIRRSGLRSRQTGLVGPNVPYDGALQEAGILSDWFALRAALPHLALRFHVTGRKCAAASAP